MNVDWIAHLPAGIRRRAYFSLQRVIGSSIRAVWQEFKSWEYLSREELDRSVDTNLRHLLLHACQASPYYRQLDLRPDSRESGSTLLRRFPILTRARVRERFRDLVIESHRSAIDSPESVSPRRYDWLVVKTGGTTGVPTSVVHDAAMRDWGRATRLYAQELCGFPLGTKYFRLWGSEIDLLEQDEKFDRRLLRNLLGEIPMNAFRAREKELLQQLETLRQHPEMHHLMAYVDAAVGLAQFVQERSLAAPPLKTIMACAGTVTPESRSILQSTFSAKVFDKYGSRECADIACECEAHNGLHVFSPHVFVEIVDEHDRPVPPGTLGRLLVTLLHNRIFPMIRYEIGDLASWSHESECACRRVFPKIASLEGRQDDMLRTLDGTLLSSVFVRHFVGVALNRQLIRSWQLEQVKEGSFIFRFVAARREGLSENLREIEQVFRKSLGSEIDFRLCEVEEIPRSPSGKTRVIINRLKEANTLAPC